MPAEKGIQHPRRHRDSQNVVEKGKKEVLPDIPVQSVAQIQCFDDAVQILPHQGDSGIFHRHIRAAAGKVRDVLNKLISSNQSMEEAARRYSPQIASRLMGEYHVLHFFGQDIRLLKKNQL